MLRDVACFKFGGGVYIVYILLLSVHLSTGSHSVREVSVLILHERLQV